MEFRYKQPTEILFGVNKVNEISEVIYRYGKRILLVGPFLNEAIQPMFNRVQKILDEAEIISSSFLEVEPNPSTKTVEKALRIAQKNQIDLIVAMGGGSVIDVAKMIGLCYGLEELNWKEMFEKYSSFDQCYDSLSLVTRPVIAIPTTAGTGSHCTQACVITDHETKMKSTIFHQDSYVKTAIIDPQLCMTLPSKITASTAFDALTHAFEAYLKNKSNPLVDYLSLQAIEWIVHYLPKVLESNRLEDRQYLSMADTFGGIALSNSGAALPHPLSEIIGSSVSSLSHGQALAMVYPSFVYYTSDKYQDKFARVCAIFDSRYQQDNEEAAKNFHNVLKKFIETNKLQMKLSDCTTKEELEEIKSCPVWDQLPMEEPKIIHQIIDDVCKK